ncbi:MAG: 2-oxoglutarate dehydrogenase, E2 component, dihydrolipoamide succinyltransferase [Candidatus Nanopelagicales bacterium]
MSQSVVLPQLGESVTEGTVTRWLKNVGDTVQVDEPLVEISTDKVDTEIPSPISGVLTEISAQVDAVVPVGGQLGVISDSAGAPTPTTTATPPAPKVEEPPAPVATPEPVAAPAPTPPAPPASAPTSGAVVEVVLPQLGESVTEGTITRWLKKVGESVGADEALVEISTDKVDTEIPSPTSGVIAEIRAQVDQTVPVGSVLATISTSQSAPAATTPPPAPSPAPVPTPAPAPVQAAPVQATPAAKVEVVEVKPAQAASESNAGAYTTPLVRQLAREKGIDLSQVKGSGVGGRIRKEDILNFVPAAPAPVATPAPKPASPSAPAAAAAPSPLRGRTETTTRLRRVIAERMVQSLQTSAQLTSVVEVDVTRISQLRDRVKNEFLKREGVKLTFLPFFAKATIEALKIHPVLNSTLNADASEITYHDAEHLAIAVDTPKGLLVPVIKDAGDLSIAGLARKITDLAARTRDNQVTPDELSGGTFTITNTGSRGALFDTPILNQPQVAIMGTGAVVKRAVVVPGEDGTDSIAVRQMVYLALTYDHRIVDGADAARFLTTVKQRLEEANFEDELGI